MDGLFGELAWVQVVGAVVGLVGVALFWRGMLGGAGGERGLLRPSAGSLRRVEGWRLTVLGLAVAGVGAAGVWEERWLLFLAAGIGFVEVLEATMVIAAWKAGAARAETSRA